MYTDFVNYTMRSLHPNPASALRATLNANLAFFFFHPIERVVFMTSTKLLVTSSWEKSVGSVSVFQWFHGIYLQGS